ncbi:MAG: DUF4350 domain-containing protein [Polyangiaceae bacterium]
MARAGRASRWLLASFALALALLRGGAVQAAFEAKDESWEGCSRLLGVAREVLGKSNVELLGRLDFSKLTPRDALLVLHPEVEVRFDPLAAFLTAGGRVAVVDDYGSGDALLRRFHIHRTNPPLSPEHTLRGDPDLAIARPALDAAHEGARHPTLKGVDEVVTNHPTALALESGVELTPLLTIPAQAEKAALLAVTGVIGDAQACGLSARSARTAPFEEHCGRLVAMGDPSVFINLMLQHPGNLAFARGLIDYLTDDDAWGPRRGKLYIVTGRFEQTGSFGGQSGLDELLSDQRAALERFWQDLQQRGFPEPVNIALGALAVLGVAGWAGFAGAQLYLRPRPSYARPLPVAAQGGFAGRFAALAARTTDRGLLMFELKRAFEAALRERLGLDLAASSRAIVDAARREGQLSARGLRSMERVLTRLSSADIAVTSGRRLRVSDQALDTTGAEILEILVEMHQESEAKRDSRAAG